MPLDLVEKKRLKALLKFENLARSKGFRSIAGIDEAGRGPLAGPVVAAACILPEKVFFAGVDDSKKLPSVIRKELFQKLTSHSKVYYGVGIVSHEVIDSINILQATIQAMLKALENLIVLPDLLLVDGMELTATHIPSWKIIQGDSLSKSIAAASIIAKVTRDQLMEEYHKKWPEYEFNQHKGYGTPKHLAALDKFGPSPIHRKSFSPVKNFTMQFKYELKVENETDSEEEEDLEEDLKDHTQQEATIYLFKTSYLQQFSSPTIQSLNF